MSRPRTSDAGAEPSTDRSPAPEEDEGAGPDDPQARDADGADTNGTGAGASAVRVGERPDEAEDEDEAADDDGEGPSEDELATGDGGDGGDPEDADEGGGGDDGHGAPTGPTWGRALLLAAALAFLGFAVGLVVSRDRSPGEGSVEVGFYRDMLTHHIQALDVASLEVTNGENRTARSYAREVLIFQAQEIGVMRQTLMEWGYDPAVRPDEAMGWMGMPVPVAEMPGLLSEDELEAMADARGAEADALFLDLMAEHHRGGLHMAQAAEEDAEDDGVRSLAAVIARGQAQEINEYRALAERDGIDVDIPAADVPPADLPDQ